MTIDSHLVYRNEIPHVFSVHAYFPSVVYLDNGDLLASFCLGEAFEAANLNSYISRSQDLGKTWEKEVPILKDNTESLRSNCVRLTAFDKGVVWAVLVVHDRRDHPRSGLANPENLGFVPTQTYLIKSFDYGHTWNEPELVTPPLVGPSFELCSPIIALEEGKLVWPTSTWRGWDGYCPNGMKMVGWVSGDEGNTWPDYVDVMSDTERGIIFWEGKIIELKNRTLLATAWAYDELNGKDLPNQYALSYDGGASWTKQASMSIFGQTMAIAEISEDQILSVYRRMDKPGLWASISSLEDERWVNNESFLLWAGTNNVSGNTAENMVTNFNELKFGAPCITLLPDGTVFVAFWCYENLVSNIRSIVLAF